MKRVLLWIVALLSALPALAQGPDDALAKITAIKRDTSYIYGIGNMPTEEQAREEALLVLADQLNPFLAEHNFSMIRTMEDMKEGTIQFLTYTKRPGQYRVLAYVDKKSLYEKEKKEVVVFQDKGKDVVEDVLGSVLASATKDDLVKVLEANAKQSYVHSGQLVPETRQLYVDNGYLVYYDRNSGKILEIMTPRDPSGKRTNARSGEATSSMKYKRLPIYWVYFEGHDIKK